MGTAEKPIRSAVREAWENVSTAAHNAIKLATSKAAIATTPRQAIWSLNKATLYRYTPKVPAAERHPIPLLLVFALINRSSILDLRPAPTTASSGSRTTCSTICPVRSAR